MSIRAFVALAFVCAFLSDLQAATAVCQPGAALADIRGLGETLVDNGAVEEMIALEGDSLRRYAEGLNVAYHAGVPLNLSHLIVAVRPDGSAVLFGFVDGCSSGRAVLGVGVHREVYGMEIEIPGAGS
jgi:hypothetical protein